MYDELIKALYDCISDKDVPRIDNEITALSAGLETMIQDLTSKQTAPGHPFSAVPGNNVNDSAGASLSQGPETAEDIMSKALDLAAVSEYRGFILGFDAARALLMGGMDKGGLL